ncbi:hypothetical protein [Desulfobacca acetoxidans]|nr:hypothetical protein [Desulfobacterales bacterium]
MKRNRMILIFGIMFICVWADPALAGDVGYRFRPSKFNLKSDALPRSGIVFFDAVVGRPLGLATTIAGTGIYVATLPMTLPTGSAGEAGWELVARPGGWTFVRPIAEEDDRFDEKGLTGGP